MLSPASEPAREPTMIQTIKSLSADLAAVEATLAEKQARINRAADMLEAAEKAGDVAGAEMLRATWRLFVADARPVGVRRNALFDALAKRSPAFMRAQMRRLP